MEVYILQVHWKCCFRLASSGKQNVVACFCSSCYLPGSSCHVSVSKIWYLKTNKSNLKQKRTPHPSINRPCWNDTCKNSGCLSIENIEMKPTLQKSQQFSTHPLGIGWKPPKPSKTVPVPNDAGLLGASGLALERLGWYHHQFEDRKYQKKYVCTVYVYNPLCSDPFCRWFWSGFWVSKHLLTAYLETSGILISKII